MSEDITIAGFSHTGLNWGVPNLKAALQKKFPNDKVTIVKPEEHNWVSPELKTRKKLEQTIESIKTQIRKNGYDYVVLELNLGNGGGPSSFNDEFFKSCESTKFVLYSGSKLDNEVSQLKTDGCNNILGYVEKPGGTEDFNNLVKNIPSNNQDNQPKQDNPSDPSKNDAPKSNDENPFDQSVSGMKSLGGDAPSYSSPNINQPKGDQDGLPSDFNPDEDGDNNAPRETEF